MISVNAACLKSSHKGTIFVYSGLTGNDEPYILAFGICGGNEDYRTWNTFNALFARACLSVSFMEDSHAYSKCVFISDREKGLDKSLTKIFPRNQATNCVHDIKQNVKTWFGPNAAEMAFPIATAFLTIQEETLLEQLKPNQQVLMTIWIKNQWSNGAIHNGLHHGSYHHNSNYHPGMAW